MLAGRAGSDHKLTVEPEPDAPPQRTTASTTTTRRTPWAAPTRRASPASTRGGPSTGQVNHTAVLSPTLFNEARVAYLHGDPVTLLGGAEPVHHLHARRERAVHDRAVARLRHLQPPVPVRGHAHVVARQPHAAHRRERGPPHVGRHRQRARHRDPRHVHVPAQRPTAPFDQLTLNDVQNYTQPIDFGDQQLRPEAVARRRVRAGQHPRCTATSRSTSALRYDRQTHDRRHHELRARASASAGIRAATRSVDPRRLRHVLHADPHQRGRQLPGERPGRADHLHRGPRAARLPDLPDRACLRCRSIRARCRPRSCRRATSRSRPGQRAILPGPVRAVRAELRPAPELPRTSS